MKKFLPLIIFVVVFAGVLASQVAYKMFNPEGVKVSVDTGEYREYENLFLHANYKNIDGGSVEMTKITAPVVIYNFWASWCIPCLEEMPSMVELKKKFTPDQIQIIAINTDEDDQIANIKKTMTKIGLKDEFVIVPDKNSELVNQFKISAIPVSIIFHRGKVVHFSNGPMDFNSEEILGKMKEWVSN
ncbi:MAG: TlpA family protein disulfide reductase [Bdellovibrionales bacterium]|nr:TlpA family protein disulfide reductase [Bdellovibrionales bacterium]